MDASEITTEIIELLRRRSRILTHVREEPREKREIVDELDIPRSTVDRAIRELESAELVAYIDGAYALTPTGSYLVHEFGEFVDRAEVTVRLEPFLRWTTPEEFDLDLRLLSDADLRTPEPNDPYAMVNRHVQAIARADHVRGMTPLTGLHAIETSYERVIEDGAIHRFIVEEGVAETLRSDDAYAALYDDLQAREEFTFAIYPDTIPYFVAIFDDEFVQIGVDEGKEPRALLESDREEVLDWASETLDRYRQRAVTDPDLLSSPADD